MIKPNLNIKIFFLIKIILFYLILSIKCYSDDLVVLGSAEALIKIKVFSSLTCPHCANFHNKVIPEIKKNMLTQLKHN